MSDRNEPEARRTHGVDEPFRYARIVLIGTAVVGLIVVLALTLLPAR